ncbi:ATP/GTP-binding protein [Streptomyces longwoodensis]|uniref:ATP/GTP-binding protein n=1 Tax=Streptomyces longwoodensis TaxID=68231 RepID=A0A101QTY0_9ACTN|nr:ATP/GTP-binding protein [Streptomyces longwoodensis]KUN36076.1 ATP/GTP-binding protein [Streptomyces longwoodensis]
MSPRRNRPKGADSVSGRSAEDDRSGRYGGWQSTVSWQGEEWSVRHVAGASAQGKAYRCPGCDQTIPDGVPHVVAWPEHAGVDDRRHWHKACWNARDRRTPGVRRSRGTPRF